MKRVAVVQLNSGGELERNLERVAELVRSAAREGAELVATPENTTYLGPQGGKLEIASKFSEIKDYFSKLAEEFSIHLLLGSTPEPSRLPRKVRNTSLLFGPDGDICANYSKIHLFDVELGGAVMSRESDTVEAGEEAVAADTPLGKLGLSICFDLRFPSHFARLRELGAEIVAIPSAFTAHTGRAHWETLVRARAIETQSYVIAPAQVGRHGNEGLKETFGNSMIVDPWGTVVARVEGGEPGYALADIDLEMVHRVRREMPLR